MFVGDRVSLVCNLYNIPLMSVLFKNYLNNFIYYENTYLVYIEFF